MLILQWLRLIRFSNFGTFCFRAITNFFLIFYQMGICCVYIVFVGENIRSVVNFYLPQENQISLTFYILMFFIPFVLIMCIRNLKLLAPFSILANIITFVTFGVVGYYVCQNLPPFSVLPQFGTLFNYPLYFGTTLFSLQAVGVVSTSSIIIFKENLLYLC